MKTAARFLGVFVNPYFVQDGGLARVFDDLESAGVTAIVTHATVARPAPAGTGTRFPPLHNEGQRRVLGRDLWGKRELVLQTFPAFAPDPALYAASPYRPKPRPLPAGVDGQVPGAMLAEARRRGWQAHLQISPFTPPGLRPQDAPVGVTGEPPPGPRVAQAACLNSPAARAYALAAIRDLVAHYPEIDGLFMDWAEYDAYSLAALFTCFCPHCERQAAAQGLDWAAMRRDVRRLWDSLHALDDAALARARRVAESPAEQGELLSGAPGLAAFLRFKADSVTGFYREVRSLLDQMGRPDIQLSARGWPPPWNRASGTDYRALAGVCHAVTPKLFTFDYCALPTWYGRTLREWNPGLSEGAILDALVAWMNLPDDIQGRTFAHYHIPGPGEPHPARLECYRARVAEVLAEVDGRARCCPFAHAYLPEPQWRDMVAMLRASRIDGLWVQMYGYLSPEKLAIVRGLWP